MTAASPQRTAGPRATTDRRSRCNREPKRPRAKSEDNQVNLPINPPPDDRNRSACANVRTSRVQERYPKSNQGRCDEACRPRTFARKQACHPVRRPNWLAPARLG